MSKDKIRVIMLRPGKRATVEVIDASLSGMQELVGGYIQAVYCNSFSLFFSSARRYVFSSFCFAISSFKRLYSAS